ncbi:MAG: type II toxin-antitoxin system mRNA interferase toxin, RelE/StbE family [Candidatus Niyogibacteria bacterium]|nr:type II toxin-antitoxin system mRNA interferase toxin, RelE/StbE family [Candidatus Niyogibacteria bacterium]
MNIRATSKFLRSYGALPRVVKNQAEKTEAIFRGDPFDPRLATHKLHGKYRNFWAFKVNREYRIMFAFVGTHEIYK